MPRRRRTSISGGARLPCRRVARARAGRAALWVLLLIVLPAILVGAFVVWKSRPRTTGGRGSQWAIPPDSQTPFAQGIRFLGVQPFGSDDLLDAEGRKVGELPYMGDGSSGGGGQLHRTFVFEYPPTDEPVQFRPSWAIRPAGRPFPLGGGTSSFTMDRDGKRLFLHDASFSSTYYESGLLSSHQVSFDRVDLVLSFYHGPPRGAQISFTGPFQTGRDYQADGGEPFTLSFPQERNRGEQVSFHFATSRPFHQTDSPWIAYDTAGRRYVLSPSGGGSSGSRGASLDYGFGDLPLERIARLVYGEQPQTRTFRNILVKYPGRPDRAYPEYYDKVAAAMGITPEELRAKNDFTPEQAAKVAALARGDLVRRLRDPLVRLKFDELPADERKRLCGLALGWMSWSGHGARSLGIGLALKWGGGEEAFRALVRLLDHGEHNDRIAVAAALYRAGALSDAQVAWVRDRLQARHDPDVSTSLMEALRRTRGPAATEALWELARAPEEEARLWWPAIQTLIGRGAVEDRAKLPEELRPRVILVARPSAGDEPWLAQAHELLARALTPRLRREEPGTFDRIWRETLRELERPAATAALVGFLRRTTAEDHADRDCLPAICRAVKQVNLWHATDFGSLGWDPRIRPGVRTGDLAGHDWAGTIAEVLKWHDAGHGRGPAPRLAEEGPADTSGPPAVGTVAQRVLPPGETGEFSQIDLDTGYLYALPDERRYRGGNPRDLEKRRDAWRAKTGVDAQAHASNEYATLVFWARAAPVPVQFWATATAELADRALAGAEAARQQVGTEDFGGVPATFAFQTAQGGLGVLAITSFTGSPASVTVRWKLLAARAPARADAGSQTPAEAP